MGEIVSVIVFFDIVALPAVGAALLLFADRLLMRRIQAANPEGTKVRTDVYSLRAAYACFVVGLAIMALWALCFAAFSLIAGIRRL